MGKSNIKAIQNKAAYEAKRIKRQRKEEAKANGTYVAPGSNKEGIKNAIENVENITNDKLKASIVEVNRYAEAHNGEIPEEINMKQMKQMADAGFSAVIVDENTPADVRNVLEFANAAMDIDPTTEEGNN